MAINATDNRSYKKLLNTAFVLSLITIFYNIAEGAVSAFFGVEDETLALAGFGADSFVEVISGLGIAHMIFRMKKADNDSRIDKFETTALKITGTAFYLLCAGLIVAALYIMAIGRNPETTLAGIIISAISILTMYFLYYFKLKTGKKLDSQPVISDAKCTKACFYLSFILLGSSLIYELFHVSYIDAIGSLGIAWYAFSEGREAFEKARTGSAACADNCSSQ